MHSNGIIGVLGTTAMYDVLFGGPQGIGLFMAVANEVILVAEFFSQVGQCGGHDGDVFGGGASYIDHGVNVFVMFVGGVEIGVCANVFDGDFEGLFLAVGGGGGVGG